MQLSWVQLSLSDWYCQFQTWRTLLIYTTVLAAGIACASTSTATTTTTVVVVTTETLSLAACNRNISWKYITKFRRGRLQVILLWKHWRHRFRFRLLVFGFHFAFSSCFRVVPYLLRWILCRIIAPIEQRACGERGDQSHQHIDTEHLNVERADRECDVQRNQLDQPSWIH